MVRLEAQNVVTDWNTIASTTIVTNSGKASVASGVWFAYTSIAVYDAVNAVHRILPGLFITTASHRPARRTRRRRWPLLIASW